MPVPSPRSALTPPSPILVLTNHLATGGAERYALSVSRRLARLGAQVVLAASPGELVDQVDPAVRYQPVDLTDLRLGVPRAAWRVRRLVRRHRPRLVLANSVVTALVGRLAAPRTPLVSVAHGWPTARYPQVAPLLRVADLVVAVSDDVARQLVGAGLGERRVRVVHNGIDLSPFTPRPAEARAAARAAFGAGDDDLVVINVGRYTEQKAQHRVIEVAARLRAELPHLRFGLVGWGPLEDDLRRRIQRAGVADVVRLLGRRDDVPDLLLAADLFLSTSRWEGMPLAIIEALAAGLPVVATDVEGVAALVDATNGARCPEDDPDALVAAVRALALDPAARRSQGDASRRRAVARFSLEAMVDNLVAVLDEAVGR